MKSIRQDTIETNLGRFLARYTPPKDLGPQAQSDEAAALFRAIDRAAPQNGYDAWWARFEDVLAETLRTRAWPTVGDVARAVKAMPVVKGVAIQDDDWLERGILKRVRHWLDGCPGDKGEKGIPGHLVTMERLNALGVFGSDAVRALAFVADPYNHGIDKKLTHEDRLEHARQQRAADAALLARRHEPPSTAVAAAPLKHWSKVAAPDDPRWAEVRRARAKSLLINLADPT